MSATTFTLGDRVRVVASGSDGFGHFLPVGSEAVVIAADDERARPAWSGPAGQAELARHGLVLVIGTGPLGPETLVQGVEPAALEVIA